MADTKNPGEDKAWELLSSMKPRDICSAAAVACEDGSGIYTIKSFGMDFHVSVPDRTISSNAAGSEVLLQRLGYFFRLSILWYLVNAKDIACSGRLVKLQNIKGGDIFTRGSHILPLEPVAQKYAVDRAGFIEKGKKFGEAIQKQGDASVRFYPLPRIPVILTLWLQDDEFPARADLFSDSTCDLQIPTDIIWSVAMMSVLIML